VRERGSGGGKGESGGQRCERVNVDCYTAEDAALTHAGEVREGGGERERERDLLPGKGCCSHVCFRGERALARDREKERERDQLLGSGCLGGRGRDQTIVVVV
jgi:hypothetical protein